MALLCQVLDRECWRSQHCVILGIPRETLSQRIPVTSSDPLSRLFCPGPVEEDKGQTGPGRERLLITQQNFFFFANDNICLLSKVLF